MAKANNIYTAIVQDISDGKYTDKLPSIRELTRKYRVTLRTMSKIVQLLVSAGMVETRPHRGIYIVPIDGNELSEAKENNVLLMVRNYGDYFGPLFHSIVDGIEHENATPVFVPHHKEGGTVKRLEALLEINARSLIIDSTIYQVDYTYLQQVAPRIPNIVFLIKRRDDLNYPCASSVLSDYYYGAHLMTNHLIELGHQRIMALYTHHEIKALEFRYLREFDFLNGYEYTMKEHGLGKQIHEIAIDNFNDPAWLRKIKRILESPQRPTAMICGQDNYALMVMDLACSMGIKVPEELSLIGYYNTSLSQHATIPLSSITVREEEIGKRAAALALQEHPVSQNIIIKPELIIRKSTAAIHSEGHPTEK